MKYSLLGVGIGAVVIAAGVALLAGHHTANILPTTVAEAKANAPNPKPKCLTNNRSIKLTQIARNQVEQIAITQLKDVPAGTNVAVQLSTYTTKSITGSDIYPSKYGSYNFIMVPHTATAEDVAAGTITSFIACQQ